MTYLTDIFINKLDIFFIDACNVPLILVKQLWFPET